MAATEDLENCVSDAIRKERQRVKKMRQAQPNDKHKITDYAAMVVACGYKRSGAVFSGKSGSPASHRFEDKLQERLEKLAPIGETRKECKNIVGGCAEPHAADKVLKAFPGCKMEELQFSWPYRPRTARRKDYCRNCKDTFFEVL